MRRGWKMKIAETQKLKEGFAAGKQQQESTSEARAMTEPRRKQANAIVPTLAATK